MVRLWSQRKRTGFAKFSFGQNTIIGSSATRTLHKKYVLRSEYVLRRLGRCHQKLRKRSRESWFQSSGSRSTLHHNQAYTSQSTTGGKATRRKRHTGNWSRNQPRVRTGILRICRRNRNSLSQDIGRINESEIGKGCQAIYKVKMKIKLSHIRTLPYKALSAFAHLSLYGLQLQVSKDG